MFLAVMTWVCGCALHAADAVVLPPFPGADVPSVEILATDPTALTGTSSAAFTVVRNGSFAKELTVKFSISGSATNGKDYKVDGALLASTLVLPANVAAQDIVITALVNPEARGNKTVILTLTADAAYTLGQKRKATVSLVDDTYNDIPPSVSLALTGGKVGGQGEVMFDLPAVVGFLATASDLDDKVVKVSFYADDTMVGSATAADAKGLFGFDWVNPRPGRYSLFARAVDQVGKSTLSQPVNVVVNGALPKVTIAPIKAPLPGGNVEVVATVSKGAGETAKVEFLGDGKSLGLGKPSATDPSAYAITWSKLGEGSHTVAVVVTDSLGFGAKASATFKVTAPPNLAPVVRIDAPKTGTSYPARPTVTLTADAVDPDGSIVRVAFYANDEVVGIVRKADAGTTAKYTAVWDKPAGGSYTVKAHATDALGRQSWSSAVKITVAK